MDKQRKGNSSSSSSSSSAAAEARDQSTAPAPPSGFLGALNNLNNHMPSYYYVIPILITLWYTLYLVGVLHYLLIYYAICAVISPHASLQPVGHLLYRCLFPFKGYSYAFKSVYHSFIFSPLPLFILLSLSLSV